MSDLKDKLSTVILLENSLATLIMMGYGSYKMKNIGKVHWFGGRVGVANAANAAILNVLQNPNVTTQVDLLEDESGVRFEMREDVKELTLEQFHEEIENYVG